MTTINPYEGNAAFDDLVPPEHGEIWVNKIGTAVLSLETLMGFYAKKNGEIVMLGDWYSDLIRRASE